MGMVIPLTMRFTTPPVAFIVLTVEDNVLIVLLNVKMSMGMSALVTFALVLTIVARDVMSDEFPLFKISVDNALALEVVPFVASTVLMELAKLGLLPMAAAISTNVFKLVGAPFTNVDIFPSK